MTAMQDAPPAHVEEAMWIEAVGHRIPAALTLPAGREPQGAVILVPGSLYIDVDGNMPMFGARPHAYADLARQLATRGIAVLRYAKRGPGTGSQVVDPVTAEAARTFRSRVDVLTAALALLRTRVPGPPTVVAGHSEGAVVAFMAAAEGLAVEGVVSLSGPSVGIFAIMREQLPVPPDAPAQAYAGFDAAVAALRAGGPMPSLDPADPTLASLAWIARSGEAGVRYMAEIDAVDPVATAARIGLPMLIVQGGRDTSVPAHHADAIQGAREAAGLPTRRAFFPELQHFYKRVAADADPMASFMIDTESDPAVPEAIVGWMGQALR